MRISYFILLAYVCLVAGQRQKQSERIPQRFKLAPEQCRLNNLITNYCCNFPPFFIRDVAEKCGARIRVKNVFDDIQVATLRRQMDLGCDHWECVLKKYDLLSDDGRLVSDEKYFAHLDRWAELNPNFASVLLNAKLNCRTNLRMIMPPNVCEFSWLNSCIRTFINLNCPASIQTPECIQLQNYLSNCKQYHAWNK